MKLVHLDPLVLMECVIYIAELLLSFIHGCAQPSVLRTDYSTVHQTEQLPSLGAHGKGWFSGC